MGPKHATPRQARVRAVKLLAVCSAILVVVDAVILFLR